MSKYKRTILVWGMVMIINMVIFQSPIVATVAVLMLVCNWVVGDEE